MSTFRKYGFCIFLMGSMIIFLGGCSFSFLSTFFPGEDREFAESTEEFSMNTEEEWKNVESQGSEQASLSEIYVHVCGCVKNPGLYHFQQGERIDAAIRAAGGFGKNADESSVNLAEVMVDGSQIEVKALMEDGAHSGSGTSDPEDSRVDLNKASQTDLMKLNGIGESRALAIITYRQEHGAFSSIEDLKKVEGIGDGIYQKIKNSIKI